MPTRKTADPPTPPDDEPEPQEDDEGDDADESRWLDLFGDWETRLQKMEETLSGKASSKPTGDGKAGRPVGNSRKRPQTPARPATESGPDNQDERGDEPDTPPIPLHRWWRKFGTG